MKKPESFRHKVYDIVKNIPQGKVASYGQIASLVGCPRCARQVGFALAALGLEEADVPWWRVIGKSGLLSIDRGDLGMEKQIQADLLTREGIGFIDAFKVDIATYLWQVEAAQPDSLNSKPKID